MRKSSRRRTATKRNRLGAQVSNPPPLLPRLESPIAYKLDPEFRSYPKPDPVLGPGADLTAQEREIVRRLAHLWRSNPLLPRDSLIRRLPKGVRLSNEQKHLLDLLRPGIADDVLQSVWLLDYVQEPPTIEQFVDDDYFLGASLRRTKDNEGLWPEWRNWLKETANLDSFLHELIVSGALGIGKTLLMVTLLLYRICICCLMRDPYTFLGLSKGSPIVFLLLSVSMDTLRATGWLTAMRLMAASRFFCEYCRCDANQIHREGEILFRTHDGNPNGARITLSGGSKNQHQIGRNLLGVGLDEGNFRLEKDPQNYAWQLFGDLRTRMISRFQTVGAFMPGLSIVASSAADESCFTENLRKQIEREGDPSGQLVIRNAIYRIKPGLKLCPWRFRVSYGLPNVEPAILRGCYDDSNREISPPVECPIELIGPHEPVPPGARIELVPGDYYATFARCPRKGLHHLSGISLGASNRLFPTLADIYKCLEISAQENIPVPTAATIISVSDEDSLNIWDSLIHKSFARAAGHDRCEPVRHPHRLRYVHLDLATTGLAALAICHLADVLARDTAGEQSENSPLSLIVEYDFILTLAGGKMRPICYEKILRFLLWLRDLCGFRFGSVTADSYQSFQMLQTLEARGIRTGNLSVDRDKRAYLAWQGGFQERAIRLYRQSQLLKEAAELIETETKIDHPPNGGTKDTTDAASGAYLNAISSEEVRNLATPRPSVIVGLSPFANASPEDPFGLYTRLKAPSVRLFKC